MSKFNMSIPCIQVSCLDENYSNFYPKFYGPDKSASLNFCHDVVKLCAGVVFARSTKVYCGTSAAVMICTGSLTTSG